MVLIIDGSSKNHSLDNLYPFGSICFVLLPWFLMSHWKTHQEIFELGLAGAQQPPRDKKAYIRIDQS